MRAIDAALTLPRSNGRGRRLIDIAIDGWAVTAATDRAILEKSVPKIQAIRSENLQASFVKGLLAGIDEPTFEETVDWTRSPCPSRKSKGPRCFPRSEPNGPISTRGPRFSGHSASPRNSGRV